MESRGGGDKDSDGGTSLLQGNHSRIILDDNMAAMSPGEEKRQTTTNSEPWHVVAFLFLKAIPIAGISFVTNF
jgi:hypothetical protein